MIEDHEMSLRKRVKLLKDKIDEEWDDPRPSRPADEVFGCIEATLAEASRYQTLPHCRPRGDQCWQRPNLAVQDGRRLIVVVPLC